MSDSPCVVSTRNGVRLTSEQLIPVVYQELRRLAGSKISHEKPGQTLTPTALVHEAFLRLMSPTGKAEWDCEKHFFAAAAEAMRRILIDASRRKSSLKHGGEQCRIMTKMEELTGGQLTGNENLLELDIALEQLHKEHPDVAELVKLRFYAGLTMAESCKLLELPERTAHRKWAFAKARLHQLISKQ